MRRILSSLVPSPAMAVAVAALLAASGGFAIAATSSNGPVLRACASKKTGALRLASKCHRGERSVSWNKQGTPGPSGLAGATGATGATGANGSQGPQGPGAITITRAIPNSETVTLATLSNGLTVSGTCFAATNVSVAIETTDKSNNFQGSGTVNREGKVFPTDVNGTSSGVGFNTANEGDVDVIARSTGFPTFERVDFHGSFGSPCTFWGTITPSG